MTHDQVVKMRNSGLCVLPAVRATKSPAPVCGAWSRFRQIPPDDVEFNGLFLRDPDAICIVTGQASVGVEAIDFDLGGELFDAWAELVTSINPDILPYCCVESTPSGGRHVFYRIETPVPGNRKLATRHVYVPNEGHNGRLEYRGKSYATRRAGNDWFAPVTMIETRGEGGIILCDPTPGYSLVNGFLDRLPVLNDAEHRVLISAARSLDETPQDTRQTAANAPESTQFSPGHVSRLGLSINGAARPGDDFNRRGDARPFLLEAGWTCVKPGDNEHWRRPGKTDGISATLKNGAFYVFSSNAAPFNADTAYGPYAVYCLLTHGGNWAAAAGELRRHGFGGEITLETAPELAAVDLSGLENSGETAGKERETTGNNGTLEVVALPLIPTEPVAEIPGADDPGILPDDLMHVPGLINAMVDYCMENAPQPNQIQAFAGALAFQAFLSGRKVCDALNNRTNLYILGLAHSASGKDFPRQVNYRLANAAGYNAGEVAGRFVSGEGIEDAVFATPNMLFQVDEIDGMLSSIGRQRKDGRPDTMMGTLLAIYTSSGGVYPMRRKASGEHTNNGAVINQPCMTLYGTAIPNHYYEAVSERMMTNGFFSRCIVLESGPRHPGRDIERTNALPERLIDAARWWRNFNPGGGNMADANPRPRTVEYTAAAREIMSHTRRLASDECAGGESENDSIKTSVWGRVHEHARKLALIYAVSENFETPVIGERAAEWGARLATYQVNRALFIAAKHVADSEFEADALKFMRKLSEAGGKLTHGEMLKKMRMNAKDFIEIANTLFDRGDIKRETVTTSTKPVIFYMKAR